MCAELEFSWRRLYLLCGEGMWCVEHCVYVWASPYVMLCTVWLCWPALTVTIVMSVLMKHMLVCCADSRILKVSLQLLVCFLVNELHIICSS